MLVYVVIIVSEVQIAGLLLFSIDNDIFNGLLVVVILRLDYNEFLKISSLKCYY